MEYCLHAGSDFVRSARLIESNLTTALLAIRFWVEIMLWPFWYLEEQKGYLSCMEA